MGKYGQLTIAMSAGLLLSGCDGAKPSKRYLHGAPPPFEAPLPDEVIPSRWVRTVSFRVDGRPEYDAHLEVGVRGRLGYDDVIRCELVISHDRFRTDRGWSPLPMALFSPEYPSSDGTEDLNDLFGKTLDFSDKRFGPEGMSFRAVFTRAKTFTGDWRIYPYLSGSGASQTCEAVATIQKSAQTDCRGGTWCGIREVLAQVDTLRYLLQSGSPREKDDLSALILRLEDLDGRGTPDGSAYSKNVPEFK